MTYRYPRLWKKLNEKEIRKVMCFIPYDSYLKGGDMKMTWVQRLYDKIRFWKTPSWFSDLMGDVQTIFLATLYQIGKEKFESIKSKILEVANSDMPNTGVGSKFEVVYNYAKSIKPDFKDSVLNALINAIVLGLKDKGVIK